MLADERDTAAWVLKAMREAGNSLASELYGLDEQALARRTADDEWSLKEIAAHLRDAEELALRQVKAILDGVPRALPAWDVDLLPAERDYRAADLSEVLAELRTLRRETQALLWGLPPSVWESSGEHPYRGVVTLEQIARELAQHDLEHLWQIRRIKHELGATAAPSRSRFRPDDWW